MKLIRIVSVLPLLAVCFPAMAQYEGTTTVNERIGHGDDSLTILGNIVYYKQCRQMKNYEEAYEPWKAVLTDAPDVEVSTYAYGADILANLIVKEQDMDKKRTYFNELMNLYDTRLANMKALNSFTNPSKQATKGDILSRKAFDYAYYGAGVAENYNTDTAYVMFREGIDLINDEGAKEVPGFVLDKFFEISYQKYQANPDAFREQFLSDYLESRDACQVMLGLANEASDTASARKIVEQYDPTLNRIEIQFAESKAADREQLIAIFSPKVEENKENLAYLKSALTLLSANDCDDTDVYFTAAEYAYALEPSFESAIGLAQKYDKDGKPAESLQYYDKALELCSTNQNKAAISLKIAKAMAKTGNTEKAYSYLDKAPEYNPAITGKASYMRAQILASDKKFSEAITYCDKAAEEDISISGSASRLKESIKKVQHDIAERDRQQAEYDAAMKRQKEEEDFWKAGQ